MQLVDVFLELIVNLFCGLSKISPIANIGRLCPIAKIGRLCPIANMGHAQGGRDWVLGFKG